jgi:cytochrome c oxidase cbb3-type subunit 2
MDPRAVVPESVMPPYAFLMKKPIDADAVVEEVKAQKAVGVPYNAEMLASAKKDLLAQADPNADGAEAVAQRYPKAQLRNFDGQAGLTEMDALIAYLQMLGTTVDFSTYQADAPANRR